MSNAPTPPATDAAKTLTKEDAAKLVKRLVEVKEGTKVVHKQVAIKAAEVLDFRDYGTHVVVVTIDGQKFSSAAAEA